MIIFDNKTQVMFGLLLIWIGGFALGSMGEHFGYAPWVAFGLSFFTCLVIVIFYWWITSGFDTITSKNEHIRLLENKRRFDEEFIDLMQDYIFMTGAIPYDRYPPHLYNMIKERVDRRIAEGYYSEKEETKDE